MNPIQREIFRNQLLLAAKMAAPAGLTIEHFTVHVKLNGFPKATKDEVEAEVTYLRDKGFVAPIEKKISPEIVALRITAAGSDYLAENGLA